jgi:hypothetical protein
LDGSGEKRIQAMTGWKERFRVDLFTATNWGGITVVVIGSREAELGEDRQGCNSRPYVCRRGARKINWLNAR